MELAALLDALSSSSVALFIAQSDFAFPAVESLHVIGIALVFGTISIVDLRLIGLAGTTRALKPLMRDSLPWTWLGFALAVITGVLMFVSNATAYWANTALKLKIVVLLLAGINMLIFELLTSRSIGRWDADPRAIPVAAKVAGALSLVFWILVVAFGRWIGFTLDAFGMPAAS